MNLRRLLLTKLVILAMAFLVVYPCFSQVKGEEIKSFSGYIESMPKDSKFIVVNEVRVFISSNTRIVDQKGNVLRIDHLKPKHLVAIDGVRKPDGISAGKITLMSAPKTRR